MVYYKKRYAKRTAKKRYVRKKRAYTRKRYYKKDHMRHKRGGRTALRVQVEKNTTPPDVMWKKFLWYENSINFVLLGTPTGDLKQSWILNLNDPCRVIPGSGYKMANYVDYYLGVQYRRLRVYAAAVTVRLRDYEFKNTQPLVAALIVDPPINQSNIDTTNLEQIMSLPTNICKRARTFQNRIGSTLILKNYYRISDMFKLTRMQYDNILPGDASVQNDYDLTAFGAGAPKDPVNLAKLTVWVGRANPNESGLSDLTMNADISVKFYCKMWDPIEYAPTITTS